MRKNIIILICLFTLNHFFAQEKKEVELQNHWFQTAKTEVNNFQITAAFFSYRFSYEMLPESSTGKKSLKLADSLKTILRNKLIQNIKGTWKLKIFTKIKTASDRRHYERLGKFLQIKKDSIFYYTNRRNIKRNNPSVSLKIKFCELMNYLPSYADFIHTNNEIWNYSIDSTKCKLTILDYGKLDNDEKNRSGVISHPSGYTYNRIK